MTRVRLRISFMIRSGALLVRNRLRCSYGKYMYDSVSSTLFSTNSARCSASACAASPRPVRPSVSRPPDPPGDIPNVFPLAHRKRIPVPADDTARPLRFRERPINCAHFCMLSPVLFLQLPFPENGPYRSSEEKEKVAEIRQMCYGKEVGFGSQPMKKREWISLTGWFGGPWKTR